MKKKVGCTPEKQDLKWWQLSLIGVGCTIGTGFFLGSSIAILRTGPSVLIMFLLAAFGTYVVYESLARMTVADPQKGSFRTYAKKAFGHWAGFGSGWVYWCSELLIMGSQLTALSIFSRFWFPQLPLWVFATGFAILGLGVVLTGTKGFERLENILAVVKIAAIVMFLIIAGAALFGLLDGGRKSTAVPNSLGEFFPGGTIGLWSSFIYAFYAFGGIEIMGLMAMRLRKPKEAPKAGKVMLMTLAGIYLLSLGLAVMMVPWKSFNSKESPFVVALGNYDLPFIPHVFNAALIIAGFSTMAASLFAVTSLLLTLAEDGDAPSIFAKKGKLKVPLPALGLTVAGLAASILLALLMPGKIYEYITTAAGLMLLYNWLMILFSTRKLLEQSLGNQIKLYVAMVLIGLAVSGTLFHESSRPGFFGSVIFLGIIALIVLKLRKTWENGTERGKPINMTLFTRTKF